MLSISKRKQIKTFFKINNFVSTKRLLELLYMDFFRPSRTMSLGENYYALVLVDDFSIYTWTLFITSKTDSFFVFKKLDKILENESSFHINSIRSDHGENFKIKNLMCCEKRGISHNFSAPRTPQRNGVV